MFQAGVRAVTLTARTVIRPTLSPNIRAFSASSRILSGAPAPQLFGPGSKPGEVPTDELQATGLERLQLLGELEGVKVFDDAPLDSSRHGTKENPILVTSLDTERIVGCTGSPADSHNLLWFVVQHDKQARCTECGSVYALDFKGEADHHDHGHH